MKGNFRVDRGILSLNALHYEIPGADVQLAGTYALGPETLDLHGKLAMQAKLSQTTTGVKSFLLKFADPFFSKKEVMARSSRLKSRVPPRVSALRGGSRP